MRGVEFGDLQQRFVDVGAIAPRAVLAAVERSEAWNERRQAAEHGRLAVAAEHRRALDRRRSASPCRRDCAPPLRSAGICCTGPVSPNHEIAVMPRPGSDLRRLSCESADALISSGCRPSSRRSAVCSSARIRSMSAGLREIGGDALLVGVQPGEVRALALAVAGIDQHAERARRIAAGRFDLDHLRAEIGELLAAIGNGVAGSRVRRRAVRSRQADI